MDEKQYEPIACGFYDQLEAFATLRKRVRLTETRECLPEIHHEGIIRDLRTAEGKEEFLVMEDGARIRLDRIKDVRALQ